MAILIHKQQSAHPAQQTVRWPAATAQGGRFANVVINKPVKKGLRIALEDAAARYEIEEAIGEGGSGRIFRAFDKVLEMEVAVKILAPHLVRDAEACAALKAEVRINLALIHKHIMRIYNLEKSGKNYLIIMELLRGKTIFQHLKESPGGFPDDFTVPLLEVAADAIGYAHRHGVLHLDLTPANIFLTDEGIVKIIDFGIAKLMGAATSANYIVGTPAYMSPEQLRGEPLDARSDIYSLGVVAAQLFTGRVLTRPGESMEVLSTTPHPPVTGVAPAVAAVIEKATAFNREDRFGAIEDFAAALRESCR